MSRTIRNNDPIVYGGKCHCPMCGINQADKYNRNIYLRYGIKPGDYRISSDEKKQNHKILRNRLKKQLRNICDEYK